MTDPRCACGGPVTVWLDWPDVPLANALRPLEATWPAPRQDLTIGRCLSCGTSRCLTPCAPRAIFPATGYPYRSGVAAAFRAHAQALAATVDGRAPHGPILDVGGNDGTLAEAFRAQGREARVVDPCVPSAEIRGFFPEATAHLPNGSLAALTALNVFAHIPNPGLFADEVRRLLTPGGLCVLEVVYVGDVLRHGHLDTLYHEHGWHWSITGLVAVLRRSGLHVQRIDRVPVQGGSVRVWATPHRQETWQEAEPDLLAATTYARAHSLWETRVGRILGHLSSGRWAGYAATAKATMLAYAAGLGPKTLAYVVDDGPDKQDRLTPYNVPIVSRERLRSDPVDGLLLFAPNYAEGLRANLTAMGWTGRVESA